MSVETNTGDQDDDDAGIRYDAVAGALAAAVIVVNSLWFDECSGTAAAQAPPLEYCRHNSVTINNLVGICEEEEGGGN